MTISNLKSIIVEISDEDSDDDEIISNYKVYIDPKDELIDPPLIWATKNNQYDIIYTLLQKYHSPDIRDHDNNTALH